MCDPCPRGCWLRAGHRGPCLGRRSRSGATVQAAPGARVEPIEATLAHFHPGTTFLRAGADGSLVTPERIAERARELGCKGVVFAGDGPATVPELAIETALACRRRGLATVAVTDGAISPEARAALFSVMDAAAVTLRRCDDGGSGPARAGTVLDALVWLANDARVWLEVRTPLVPGWNDHPEDVRALARWVHEALGPAVPVHFDAAGAGRAAARATTPDHARGLARRLGLRHVYAAGAPGGQTTTCAVCGHALIERQGLVVSACRLTPDARCPACRAPLAGRFDGRAGRALEEAA